MARGQQVPVGLHLRTAASITAKTGRAFEPKRRVVETVVASWLSYRHFPGSNLDDFKPDQQTALAKGGGGGGGAETSLGHRSGQLGARLGNDQPSMRPASPRPPAQAPRGRFDGDVFSGPHSTPTPPQATVVCCRSRLPLANGGPTALV